MAATSDNSRLISLTNKDKDIIAEWAFKGSQSDPTAYIKTVVELQRFLSRYPLLVHVFADNDNQYRRVPHARIFAVDVLREAFVSDPAHSFTTSRSKHSDPRAIFREIQNVYNRAGVPLYELRYRDAPRHCGKASMDSDANPLKQICVNLKPSQIKNY